MTRPAAIILAGGASSRMGRDKWSLPWGSTTILQTLRASLGACCSPVVAVMRSQQHDSVGELTCIPDLPGLVGQGPLTGCLAGLEYLATLPVARVFLTACDHPLIDPPTVQWMAGRLDESRAAGVVIANESGRIQPDFGMLDVSRALRRARSLVDSGERRLRALYSVDCERVLASSLPDPCVLASCNTPEEYRRLRAVHDRVVAGDRVPDPGSRRG